MFVAHYYGRLLNIHPSPAKISGCIPIAVRWKTAIKRGARYLGAFRGDRRTLTAARLRLRAKVLVFADDSEDDTHRTRTDSGTCDFPSGCD